MTTIQTVHSQPDTVVVLFSGGRDSSLAACLLAAAGARVHLLTTLNGATLYGDLSALRSEELKAAFPNQIVDRTIIPSHGLFRRVALEHIEEDFHLFRTNLIPVGDALATHAVGISFALSCGIGAIASGYATYESDFPEQMPDVITLTRQFVESYGLTYLTPVLCYTDRKQVKQHLLDYGISPKSLEGTSLFADTFSSPEADAVVAYVRRKLPICRDYIAFRRATKHGSQES